MTGVAWVAALTAAFFLGAIPTALWVSRRQGVDLRQAGSGNLGATNVYRVLGRRLGLAVLAVDMAKGAAAVGAARGLDLGPLGWLAAAVAAVAGHIWSPWMQFRGGKGVATGGGAVLALAPAVGVMALGVFALVVVLSRRVSVASMVAALALPCLVWWRQPPVPGLVWVTVGIAAVVIARHRANLARLVRGEEGHFDWRGGGGQP